MFEPKDAFSGFSVNSSVKAREFYGDVLGLKIEKHGYGTQILLPGGSKAFFYPKGAGHKPASFTILDLVVDDIDIAVAELKSRGVVFEQYEYTDKDDIQRGLEKNMGPDIAWFKDPAGNIIAVIKES